MEEDFNERYGHPRITMVTYHGGNRLSLSIPKVQSFLQVPWEAHFTPNTQTLPSNIIPEMKNAKNNSHLPKGTTATWAENVIQDFSFGKGCSTTVQPRTINTTHLPEYGNSSDEKNVLLL